MRWTVVVGALMVAVTPAARAERPCPPGAERRGAAPPDGHAVWCVSGGVHHGPWAMWFLDGTPMREGFLHRGRMQGRFASWHKNGQLAEESFFRAGVRVGVWHAWRADGSPVYVTPYRNGKKHGYDKRYHPNGKLASSTRWRWGKRHGVHIERDDHGKLVVRGSYRKDLRHGTWRRDLADGQLVETYDAGRLTAATWNGKPVIDLCDGITDHITDTEPNPGGTFLHDRCVSLAGKRPRAVLCLNRATTWDQVFDCYGVAADTTD